MTELPTDRGPFGNTPSKKPTRPIGDLLEASLSLFVGMIRVILFIAVMM